MYNNALVNIAATLSPKHNAVGDGITGLHLPHVDARTGHLKWVVEESE